MNHPPHWTWALWFLVIVVTLVTQTHRIVGAIDRNTLSIAQQVQHD